MRSGVQFSSAAWGSNLGRRFHESLEQLQKREADATERTKSARRNATRRLHHAKVIPLPIVAAHEEDAGWDEAVEPFEDIRML
jgi:hypothetical protein